MKRLASAAVALILSAATAACSGTADSTAATTSAAATSAPVDTSAVPHGNFVHPTNIEHYKVFANRDDAVTWWNAWEGRTAQMMGRSPRPIVDLNDPGYAIAAQVMAEVWPVFQSLFPDDTRDLPQPMVLLVQDQDVNAFAAYDSTLGIAPDVFMIQTGAVAGKSGVTDDLRGLVGHELGHLILKHVFPGNAAKVAKYYRGARSGEPLGYLESNDPKLAKAVEKWVDDASVAASFPLPELHGLPINIIGNPPVLFTALKTAVLKGVQDHPTECQPAEDAVNGLIVAMKSHTSTVDYDMDLGAEARSQIDTAAQAAVTALGPCLATSTKTVSELVAETYGVSVADIESAFDPADLVILHAATTLEDAITKTTANAFARMQSEAQDIDLDTVRYYSTEEQADDTSAYVLATLGRNPEGQGLFLGSKLMTPDERTTCFDRLNTAGDAPYGLLSDPHHGACWRVGHLHRFHAKIAPGVPGSFED
jgi:hypothetical protein